MGQDLRSYFEDADDILLRVAQPVARDHLSALIVQANQPVVFEQIEGHPGWKVADLLFRDRLAQSRVLGTTPDQVLPELGRRLALPPRAPRVVNSGPVKDRILRDDEIDLRELPTFQHGARDPGPGIICMNICRAPDGGNINFSFTKKWFNIYVCRYFNS